MHVVGIHRLRGNEELLARELSTLLGKAVAEARGRVRVAASGPAVVATFALAEPAAALAAELRRHGFDVLALGPAEIAAVETPSDVGRVSLGSDALVAQSGAQRIEVRYDSLLHLLAGNSTHFERTAVVTRERRFSPARFILSGGLMLTRRSTGRKIVQREERERFLWLRAAGAPALALREGSLSYGEIGAARAASSSGNLALLAGELRRRCPQATYDDRLESRAVQVQILGATLSPDRHLDVAIALVLSTLGQAAS